MKRSFIIFGLALAISACGNNKQSGGSSTDTTVTTTTTTSSTQSTSVAVKDTLGAGLIQKNDCLTCHKLDQKIIGPAFNDIANKYTVSPAVVDTLANKIIKGGSGNWGTIAMSPHPNLSMTDAQEMVKYILSLKK
jgi:cytochrome c